LWLNDCRYIKLQEEYIKDEQRYELNICFLHGTETDTLQELEEGVGSGTRGDQANPECTFGDRAIYGSHRPKVRTTPLPLWIYTDTNSTGIVQSSTGSNYVVRILSTLDREKLKPSSSVALHRHSNSLVDILPPEADSSIAMLGQDEKPDVTYADVGGLDMQKQEIREAVELPLTVGPLRV
jgi:26S proteasome regulatory subunit T3